MKKDDLPENQQGWSSPTLQRPNVGTAAGGGGGPVGGGIGLLDRPREFLHQVRDTLQYRYDEWMPPEEERRHRLHTNLYQPISPTSSEIGAQSPRNVFHQPSQEISPPQTEMREPDLPRKNEEEEIPENQQGHSMPRFQRPNVGTAVGGGVGPVGGGIGLFDCLREFVNKIRDSIQYIYDDWSSYEKWKNHSE